MGCWIYKIQKFYVLIVAECNVNRLNETAKFYGIEVLIVAECNVNFS